MDNNSLFPFKYRLRKTGEAVEVIAWGTADKGARSNDDWVSYIDANGVEHVKERLTLEWDFVIDTPFDSLMSRWEPTKLPEFDPWEARRYELVKSQVLDHGEFLSNAIEKADKIIAALKSKEE